MTRVLVTGSAQGIGYATVEDLLGSGCEVVVHVRSEDRLPAVAKLVTAGAMPVVGDLASIESTMELAEQIRSLGHMDVVIHNAGVYGGAGELAVNVIAPYVLSAALPRPGRQIFVSSDMHPAGRPDLARVRWDDPRSGNYADSKLYVTALAFALGARWSMVQSHAVDPGWVPTRMGGPSAPDDLSLAHQTQVWLATCAVSEIGSEPGYWYHRRRQRPAPAVLEPGFQDAILDSLARHTGMALR